MDAKEILGIAVVVFGLGMAVGPLLQMGRILRRRHSGDVSVVYLWVIAAGAGVYAAYGAADGGNWVLIVPNMVGVLTNLATIFVVYLYRDGNPGR